VTNSEKMLLAVIATKNTEALIAADVIANKCLHIFGFICPTVSL
jgi:hypothetical protein